MSQSIGKTRHQREVGRIFDSESSLPKLMTAGLADREKQKYNLRNTIHIERDILRGGSPHASEERVRGLEKCFYDNDGEEA